MNSLIKTSLAFFLIVLTSLPSRAFENSRSASNSIFQGSDHTAVPSVISQRVALNATEREKYQLMSAQ